MGSDYKKPIIFTDLDGSLLDHNDYSFTAALPALKKIKDHAIPLIFNSSKTSIEIINLQTRLGICQPFISENGAVVYIPKNESDAGKVLQKTNFFCHAFAKTQVQVLDILNELRKKNRYRFIGFSDCDSQAICDLTDLPLAQAIQATDRDYSEPLLWQDTADRQILFIKQLEQRGLIAQQGGRFLSITDKVDKAKSMQWLCNKLGGEYLIVAIGDSHNDEAMLNVADIAIVIKSIYSENINISTEKKIIKTSLPGPAGWQEAMNEVLPLII
jgi:mannosyl-3-phosphoglycerate phosphatase